MGKIIASNSNSKFENLRWIPGHLEPGHLEPGHLEPGHPSFKF